MASRLSVAVALCALTSASIAPLSAGPRQITISPDGTIMTDSTETKGKRKGQDPDHVRGPKKDRGDGGTTDGGDGGTIGDGGTGGGDTGGGGTGGGDTGGGDTGGGTSGGGDTGGGGTGGGDTGGGGTSGGGDTGGDDGTGTSDLPPLNLSDMALWNWSGKWHASEWNNSFSTIPWRYNHVQQGSNGDTYFLFNQDGAPELKAQGGHPYSTKAYYEVDVTLPELRSGMVVAPLWLWHDNTRDEVDFEFVGDQFLQLTVHSYRSGSHRTQEYRIPGNFSGQRMRLAMETDLSGGYINMFINGQLAHTFYNNTMAFPIGEMRPVMSMWVGDNVGWAEAWTGPWGGFANGETLTMTIHGYRFEQR